jgi:hypothetical protein
MLFLFHSKEEKPECSQAFFMTFQKIYLYIY